MVRMGSSLQLIHRREATVRFSGTGVGGRGAVALEHGAVMG